MTSSIVSAALALMLIVSENGHSTPQSMKLKELAGWTIILGKEAIPSERYAAEEFQRLFELATGTKLYCLQAAGSEDQPLEGRELIFPFVLDSDRIELGVIKKAASDDRFILRLYEPRGRRSSCTLTFADPHTKLQETDLMEKAVAELSVNEGKVHLELDRLRSRR